MPRNLSTAAAIALAATLAATGVRAADDHKDHGKMDHGQMNHDAMGGSKTEQGAAAQDAKPGVTEASGVGVINAVDTAKQQVNLTHEPIPDLGWPQMTMDLPVTSGVDLAGIAVGDKVAFKLKLGRDKVYRIMAMDKAK